MRVVVLGGGPAGLYFALLLRKLAPDVHVSLYERNAPDDTFGWGVVFSDQTLENFRAADDQTYQAITDAFAHWDDIDIHVHGRVITSGGHGFSGIARKTLLRILRDRAMSLGVRVCFGTEVSDVAALITLEGTAARPDLVVAADGVNSIVRQAYAAEFGASVDQRSARYIWLGTTRRFDAFTFAFVENDAGVFQAHAYRFDDAQSAFIVECDEASWRAAGFDTMDAAQTVAACERLFARWLDGHPLLFNATPHRHRDPWVTFLRVSCARWRHGNVVLLGDAAHTAHFSIGSGTKLAMEDAIVLAREVAGVDEESGDGTPRSRSGSATTTGSAPSSDDPAAASATISSALEQALDRYESERRTEVLRLQNAARNSMEWFENVRRYIRLEPEQFAYSLLTRSQRVSHENLRLRDRAYLGGVERWFASRASRLAAEAGTAAVAGDGPPTTPDSPPAPPPMFTPFTLRGMTLDNRIVVSPMDMYSATDGTPNDFHLVHYGSLALGGAGLLMTEMTCVSPDARISLGCTGMYHADHTASWRRVTDMVHRWSRARICLQLGHSGRKGAVRSGLEWGDYPLEDDGGAWEVIGPSAEPHRPGMQIPRAMTREDMDRVVREFVTATRLALEADFDMIELHCAHGYLLSSFITPVANRRQDDYGGTLANRLRFPLEVFRSMRSAWPQDRPMSVRISATDWVEGGVDAADSVEIAKAFVSAGADIMHVSTGQTSPDARPVYGRMWQTPFSDRIRNESGIRTIAVGSITDPDQVNSIIAAGRADLCALARPHLSDPHWTLHAAAQLGFSAQHWPWQYESGKEQLERLLARAAAPAPPPNVAPVSPGGSR